MDFQVLLLRLQFAVMKLVGSIQTLIIFKVKISNIMILFMWKTFSPVVVRVSIHKGLFEHSHIDLNHNSCSSPLKWIGELSPPCRFHNCVLYHTSKLK